MRKVFWIANREFLSTVTTRGFIIVWVVMPVLVGLLLYAAPKLTQRSIVATVGKIAILDPTGLVGTTLRTTVDPRNLAALQRASAHDSPPAGWLSGPLPQLAVLDHPDSLAAQKAWLVQPAGAPRHLAVVVVRPQALALTAADELAPAYDLYVPAHLDARTQAVIRGVVDNAVIAARARTHGMNFADLQAMTHVAPGPSFEIGPDGAEHPTASALKTMLLPFALMFMMVTGVLGSGQFLLTTMVEEKASRIIELLLSAAAPLELLSGKIAGQLAAALIGMSLYVLAIMAALLAFALFGMVQPELLLYLLLFFVIGFLTVGSLMVGVGAAVSDIRDAQALLMPFTLAITALWVLVFPISLNPGSKLATALSFTPLVNPFVIMIRIASTSPPPAWQIGGALAISLAAVGAAIWFAAKVFRIALLLHGKPPNLGTLLRWAVAS
jgi:ABC-2 type transport system permease protein